MTPTQLNTLILTPALSLLEARYDTPEARAMLIAIALQESGLRARRQIQGPARGFWQFEEGGVIGVISHHATRQTIATITDMLAYPATVQAIHPAIENNDILAAVCARLLLFTHPDPMPARAEWMKAWAIYAHDLWKPGKPRFESWEKNWDTAWEAVA